MKAILVLVAAIAFVTAPFWSTGFNGFEPDQFPIPQDKPPAQPAGYAFSIWGVIYLWLLVAAGFGLFARADDAEWDWHRWPLFISLGVGASWLAVAQTSPIWAMVLIWVMLTTALIAMLRAPRREPWWGRYGLELYAGWLTAASSVSIALVGAGYGVGFNALGWAYLVLILAIAIAAWVLWLGPAPAYAFAVAWALVAVCVANWGAETGVVLLAAIGVLLVAGLTVLRR